MSPAIAAILAIAAFLFQSLPAGASDARASKHVYVLWLDGTTLGDWSAPSLRSFNDLLSSSSIALLSTRTNPESSDPATMRRLAALALSTGSSQSVDRATTPTFGDALRRAGVVSEVLGDADGRGFTDRSAALALRTSDGGLPKVTPRSIPDPSFPTGRVSAVGDLQSALRSVQARSSLIVVDPGDTERLQRSFGATVPGSAMGIAMARADLWLQVIVSERRPGDTVVVISPTTPVSRQRHGIRLSAIAINGPSFPQGVLRSGTTRLDGVVGLADVPDTIASILGVSFTGEGRIARGVRDTAAVRHATSLEADAIVGARLRYPLTRLLLFESMAVAIIAAGFLFVGGRFHTSRAGRAILQTALLFTIALPIAMYCVGAFRPTGAGVAVAEVVGLALAISLIPRMFVGPIVTATGILAASALVPLVDLVLGTPLGRRSPIDFQIAAGSRFFGVGGDVLGLVVGAVILSVGLLLGNRRRTNGTMWAACLGPTAVIGLLALPEFGAKFGAIPTAVPAIAVLIFSAGGKRMNVKRLVLIALGTIVVAGIVVGVDLLATPQGRSHVGPAFESRTGLWSIVSRKIKNDLTLSVHTLWVPAMVVVVGSLLIVAWRRRGEATYAIGRHSAQGTFIAASIAIVAGFLFNDTGPIVATYIAVLASMSVFALLLEPAATSP